MLLINSLINFCFLPESLIHVKFHWIVHSVQRTVPLKLGYRLLNGAPYKNQPFIPVGSWPKFVAASVACTIQHCNVPQTIQNPYHCFILYALFYEPCTLW